MPILTYNKETFECARAQKGSDFVRLLDENNNEIFFAAGVTDFSKFSLTDGDWETPVATVAPIVGATATLNGSTVVLDIPSSVRVESQLILTFKAPCNCSAVSCLSLCGEKYTIKDVHGNTLTGYGGTWTSGSMIVVVLDVLSKTAFLVKDCGTRFDVRTYTGVKKYGPENPNTLTFNFQPKIVLIIGGQGELYSVDRSFGFLTNGYGMSFNLEMRSSNSSFDVTPLYVTMNGNTVSWYATWIAQLWGGNSVSFDSDSYGAAGQLNEQDTTYTAIAI